MKIIKLTNTIGISYTAASEEEFDKYKMIDINAIDQRVINTYHSKTIQKKAKVSAIQIGHWTRTTVIVPATAVKGTGKMHIYDHKNLIEAMICRELSQFSINYGVMREVLDFLRKKKWLFDIGLSRERKPYSEAIIDGQFTATISATVSEIQKHLTIWDFFKLYPQTEIFYLLLWKNSTSIELQEPKTGDYNFYVTTRHLTEIISRCKNTIVINLSNLLSEAGSFYEEAES